LDLNLDRVRMNIQAADTEDLLDRVTVFGSGMEPEAIRLIYEELRSRGVFQSDIEAHNAKRRNDVRLWAAGTAKKCTFCHRPAVAEGRGWHRLWRWIPVFPRMFYYCEEHLPNRS
jgi:hypothetical protein